MTVEEKHDTSQPGEEIQDAALLQPESEETDDTEEARQASEKEWRPYMSNQFMVLPAKSYFWTMILFCIPVLGQFVCLIMALGGSRYRNKINFARACLLLMLLQAAILAGLYFLSLHVWGSLMDSLHQFLMNTGVGYPADWTQLDQWVKNLQEVPSVREYLQTLNAQAGQ